MTLTSLVQSLWPPFGTNPAAPSGPAADLYEAVWLAAYGSATLASLFGRSDFLWLDLAPPDAPLPVAVLSQVDGTASLESPVDDSTGAANWVGVETFQVAVFSTNRRTSRQLARSIAGVIETADATDGLTNDESAPLFVRRIGAGFDTRDPDQAPDGGDVWGHVIQFRAVSEEAE